MSKIISNYANERYSSQIQAAMRQKDSLCTSRWLNIKILLARSIWPQKAVLRVCYSQNFHLEATLLTRIDKIWQELTRMTGKYNAKTVEIFWQYESIFITKYDEIRKRLTYPNKNKMNNKANLRTLRINARGKKSRDSVFDLAFKDPVHRSATQ